MTIRKRRAQIAVTAGFAAAVSLLLFSAPAAPRLAAGPRDHGAPLSSSRSASPSASASASPTFYRDVLPIFQERCQGCHRPGEVGTFPLVTYAQARPYAAAISQAVVSKMMPPWFADPQVGHFSDDPSLTAQEIATVERWAHSGAPAGNPKDAPPPRQWAEGWNIPQPDLVLQMPKPVSLPATGDIEYTYEIVPTGFTEDKWIEMAQVRPSNPEQVHHAVIFIRPPNSQWLRKAPVGTPFTASSLPDEQSRRDAHWSDSDLLLVYAPGSSPDLWPAGLAKFIPAGSDLVFQMHYMAHGHPATDQTSIGLVFAKKPPPQRVITLQLTNDRFVIPPHDADYRVEVRGTLPNQATLLSFFPHMHLRGKRFEFNLIHADGQVEPLLRVNWNFYWQLSYRLAQPRVLPAGSILQAVAWYDNSANNPHNPDPDAAVRWGDQTYDEMMIGFFDVAVAADMDKWHFFVRAPNNPALH